MKVARYIIALLLLVTGVSSNAFAVKHLGTLDGLGAVHDITIVGDYAYVTRNSAGVSCIDLKTNQIVSSWKNTEDKNVQSREVLVKDNFLIVAERLGGTRFFDISNPNELKLVATVANPDIGAPGSLSSRLSISGNTLYVGSMVGGMISVDITDMHNPKMLDHIRFKNSSGSFIEGQGISVQGDLAFVATPWGGWSVVDVSDPSNMQHVTSVPRPAGARPGVWDVEVRDKYAYVLAQNYGVQVFDVSDINNITLLSEVLMGAPGGFGPDSPPADIKFLNDTLAFVTHGTEGVFLYDFSNVLQPLFLEQIVLASGGAAVNAFIQGSTLYVTAYRGGLEMFDISKYVKAATPVPATLLLAGSGVYMLYRRRKKIEKTAK